MNRLPDGDTYYPGLEIGGELIKTRHHAGRRLPYSNDRSVVMDARIVKIAGTNFNTPDGIFAVKVRYLRADGEVSHQQFRFRFLTKAREFARQVTRIG